MKIGIDVRKIRDGGIGTYIRCLLTELLEIDRASEFVLFGYPDDRDILPLSDSQVEWVPCRAGKYSVMEHISLPLLARRWKIELFHSPHYTLPLFLSCPSVVTIHDLIHLKFPENLPTKFHNFYARKMAGSAARRAEIVITVSNHSKEDIGSLLGVREDKVRVINNGVEGEYFESLPDPPVGDPYILVVSNLKPHKNLEGMIRVFSIVTDRIPHKLVVTCNKPSDKSILWKLIQEEGLMDRIEFLGCLGHVELRKVYANASMLLSLSHYEGFGLPIIEAMASGVPVVLSRVSSHPEVAGDAAVMVEPGDNMYAASAIMRLIYSKSERDDYIRKGLERSKRFSWKETAAKTLECYKEAHESMSRS
jgi:alpha-1,3-rhamnosyl/mannosyltransferase